MRKEEEVNLSLEKVNSSLSEVELLIFLLDGSGSMVNPEEGGTATFDGRTKAEHLFEIIEEFLNRLNKTDKAPTFRVSLVYFSEKTHIVESTGVQYFTVGKAFTLLQNPCNITGGGKTSITDALSTALNILKDFDTDEGMPSNKKATVFLVTDGKETIKRPDDIRTGIRDLRYHTLSPIIAVISMGIDADDPLLLELASEASEAQQRHLANAGVLNLIADNPPRLFIKGHTEGTMKENHAEAIRQFVNVLSKSKK